MKRYNIDKQKIALAGFSDGATVAISLLPLGGIATHIIAWSPGGFAPPMVVSVCVCVRVLGLLFGGCRGRQLPAGKAAKGGTNRPWGGGVVQLPPLTHNRLDDDTNPFA